MNWDKEKTLPPEEQEKDKMISSLEQQIADLKKQVQSASLEMEVMRAEMNDLKKDAAQSVNLVRFQVPDSDRMREINESVQLLLRAIQKERRSRKTPYSPEGTLSGGSESPQKLDEKMILIILKLRRKGCSVREIANHTGLGRGTVHSTIQKYINSPEMQDLITEGTQMELTDYILVKPEAED